MDEIELGGLDEAERRELLALLEERERRMANWPEDTREPLSAIVARLREEAAATTDDPDGFREAWERHERSRQTHMRVLLPMGWADEIEIDEWMSTALTAFSSAVNLAEADGFPSPDPQAFRLSSTSTMRQ